MENEFLMIPKDTITNKKYNNKLLGIIVYAMCSENKLGLTKFTLSEFIEFGLWNKPRYGQANIIAEAKGFLLEMINDGYLNIVGNIGKITLNANIIAKLNLKYDKNDKGEVINWFKLEIENYRTIFEYKGKLKKETLLNLYCYILSKIIKRNDGIDNIQITGGSAEVFWCKQEDICKDLNLAKGTLNTYLKKLRELSLVHYGNIGVCRKDGDIIKPHNVYALDEVELTDGLKQSKYYWESNGWKVFKK